MLHEDPPTGLVELLFFLFPDLASLNSMEPLLVYLRLRQSYVILEGV